MKTINLLLCALCSLSMVASDDTFVTPLKEVSNAVAARRSKKRRLGFDEAVEQTPETCSLVKRLFQAIKENNHGEFVLTTEGQANPYESVYEGKERWSLLSYAVSKMSPVFPTVFAACWEYEDRPLLWEEYIKAWYNYARDKGECPSFLGEHEIIVCGSKKKLRALIERDFNWAVLPAA